MPSETEGNIEGKTEGTGRRGRRRKQLLDDLKETRFLHTVKRMWTNLIDHILRKNCLPKLKEI